MFHFVDIDSRRMKKEIRHIPRETVEAFMTYSWPGYVRELQNLVERAVILSNDMVLPNPLPVKVEGFSGAAIRSSGIFSDSQRALIVQALEATGWVIGGAHGAAARLGLKRTTLITKMRKFGISRPRFQDNLENVLDRHPKELYGRSAID